MQKECIHSVSLADKELEEVRFQISLSLCLTFNLSLQMATAINNTRKKFEEGGTSQEIDVTLGIPLNGV